MTSPPASAYPAQPRIRLSGPADVAAAVPVLLGFHPRESLVVLALTGERSRVGLVQRVDLADLHAGRFDELTLAGNCGRDGARAALAVVLSESPDDAAGLPHADRVSQLRADLQSIGVPLVDALLVRAGRAFSYLCVDPGCCPPEGLVLPQRGSRPVEAAGVLAGIVVRADREAALPSLGPASALESAEFRQALDRVSARRVAEGGGVRRARLRRADLVTVEDLLGRPPESWAADGLAQALLCVQDVLVRDCLLDHAGEPGPGSAADLWTRLTRLAPDHLVSAPATLLAADAYAMGEGLVAAAALERALGADPGYRLAGLLGTMLQAAVHPDEVRACLLAGSMESRRRLARATRQRRR